MIHSLKMHIIEYFCTLDELKICSNCGLFVGPVDSFSIFLSLFFLESGDMYHNIFVLLLGNNEC